MDLIHKKSLFFSVNKDLIHANVSSIASACLFCSASYLPDVAVCFWSLLSINMCRTMMHVVFGADLVRKHLDWLTLTDVRL